MGMIDYMLQEYLHEAANTRKVLERIPEADLGWKPHEKSMTFGRLASHVAEVFGWPKEILTQDVLDIPADFTGWEAKNRAEIVAKLDASIAAATAALKATPDSKLGEIWKMKMGGQTVIEMPRAAVMRAWVFNHSVHHRGQLTVYLRLRNVPVPALYGPSADEK